MAIISGTTNVSRYELIISFDSKTGQSTPRLECKSAIAGQALVHLFFSGSKGGFRTTGTGNIVYDIADRESFFAVYHMLQTERPVKIDWRVESTDNKVIDLSISTGDEPVGELEPQENL
jgi:hypothetical protein